MHVRKHRKGCGHSRILKIKKIIIDTRFLRGNLNREKTTGDNNGAKIHYDRSEYKTISKVNQKILIQKRDKYLNSVIRSKE